MDPCRRRRRPNLRIDSLLSSSSTTTSSFLAMASVRVAVSLEHHLPCTASFGARQRRSLKRWVGRWPNTSVSLWLCWVLSGSQSRVAAVVASDAADWAVVGRLCNQPANHRAERLQTPWDSRATATEAGSGGRHVSCPFL